MAWDFSTDPDYDAKLRWARDFVREEIWPIEKVFSELSQADLDQVMTSRYLEAEVQVGRYHSLVLDEAALPDILWGTHD